METVVVLLIKYKYLVLFPFAIVEGPLLSLIIGFLVFNGTLNFWLALIILLIGDIIPDTLFYCIGYFGRGSKFIKGKIIESDFFSKNLLVMERLWDEHTLKIMFLGKLAFGVSIPFLISSGMARISYKKFILFAILVDVFKFCVIILIGYIMGNSYMLASRYISFVYYILAIVIIVLVAAYYLIIRYSRRKIISLVDEERDLEA